MGNHRSIRTAALAAMCVLALATPLTARAQSQRQLDAHGNFSRGTTSQSNSWGAGSQFQVVWGAKHAPVQLATSLGGDYTNQSGGPTQWNAATDVVLQSGGSGVVTPYVGGSVGSNWSTGTGAMWSGARLGLETLAGAQVKIRSASKSPNIKVEERYGYVRGQEHTLATRLGVGVPF
jgi:hypothetical protein